jgi:hypothetical protein
MQAASLTNSCMQAAAAIDDKTPPRTQAVSAGIGENLQYYPIPHYSSVKAA